ncbi:hypothetical protein [Streptomyces sp. Root369]|uniref:hypothetical protein n=1 Tax=Streptomyces sp. Root369 TaxID=1736523 RepID=UPI00070D2642|nr:hypothetical protein [Streptomyces sp. Root369]KQV99374.1 hypothetical protein ASD08_47415 [Streptomyces sp. Root369]
MTPELGQGWTERMLLDTAATVAPGARAVLRRLVEAVGTASYEEVQDHFTVHPETPIDPKPIGGTLTSIRAVRTGACAPPVGRALPILPP